MAVTAVFNSNTVPPAAPDCPRADLDVVELPLLLPRWQADVLEAAAARRGMTTGQILRRVIGDVFGGMPMSNAEASASGR